MTSTPDEIEPFSQSEIEELWQKHRPVWGLQQRLVWFNEDGLVKWEDPARNIQMCRICEKPWPCRIARLLATVRTSTPHGT